jgi:hypothetical protein
MSLARSWASAEQRSFVMTGRPFSKQIGGTGCVGAAVGDSVGERVGDVVGDWVGEVVGNDVGEAVMRHVWHSASPGVHS